MSLLILKNNISLNINFYIMAIPSKQIGWGTEENLLWEISKRLETLTGVIGSIGQTSSTTTTTTTTTTTP